MNLLINELNIHGDYTLDSDYNLTVGNMSLEVTTDSDIVFDFDSNIFDIYTENNDYLSTEQLYILLNCLGIEHYSNLPLFDAIKVRTIQTNENLQLAVDGPWFVKTKDIEKTTITLNSDSILISTTPGQQEFVNLADAMGIVTFGNFFFLYPISFTARAVGDPYVKLFAEKSYRYKIPGKIATYRLIEYSNIIVNGTVSGLNSIEVANIQKKGRFVHGFYFEKFFISYDKIHHLEFDRYCNLTAATTPYVFKVRESGKIQFEQDEIQGSLKYKTTTISINGVIIELRKYISAEVINGIIIKTISLPNKGLLANYIHPNWFKIGSLYNLKPIASIPKKAPSYNFLPVEGWNTKWLM